MKIVHVNCSDSGGAGIAALRHHEAMLKAGFDSRILFLHKSSADGQGELLKSYKPKYFLGKVINRLLMTRMKYYATWSWAHFGCDIDKEAAVKEADIVFLHWVNGYAASLSSIERLLASGKQVYWFLHDMWPITGGCHHSFECEKFKTHCMGCIMSHNRKGTNMVKDLSYRQFDEKLRRLSPYQNLHFLAPSQWLVSKVKESALFGKHDIRLVRNVLDTSKFIKRDKTECRKRLGLPYDKRLILFGADNINSPYKGWKYLEEALSSPIANCECVIYGTIGEIKKNKIALQTNILGRISDIDKLIDLYNACDIFVTPSIADNYPNVLIEAMACGLPCIGFATGGIPEIIIDGENGCIVKEYDGMQLRRSIINLMKSDNLLKAYSQNSIESICNNNGYDHIMSIHSELNNC